MPWGRADARSVPRKPLPDYIVEKEKRFCRTRSATRGRDIGAAVPAGQDVVMSMDGRARARGGWHGKFLPQRWRGSHHHGRPPGLPVTPKLRVIDPPVFARRLEGTERSARSRLRVRSHSPVREPHRNRGLQQASAISIANVHDNDELAALNRPHRRAHRRQTLW